jgi:chromosome segregation ATPase
VAKDHTFYMSEKESAISFQQELDGANESTDLKSLAQRLIAALTEQTAELADQKSQFDADQEKLQADIEQVQQQLAQKSKDFAEYYAAYNSLQEKKEAAVTTVADEPNVIDLAGKKVKIKFGVHEPDTKKFYSVADLLNEPDVVAYLLEENSGAVELLEVKEETK